MGQLTTKCRACRDRQIREVTCYTSAIEFLRSGYRRAVRIRNHFLAEQAALK
jgi:transposase-like protein